MTRNAEVAGILEEFADLLDAKDVEFKPRSYRRAAENILEYPVAIEELAADGEDAITEIEGVGDAIASKVVEYLTGGHIEELDDLRNELPVRMDELTAVEGVGPKSVGTLYRELGITTLDELEQAAEAGEIREVKGFGEKSETNILEHIPFAKTTQARELLGHARPVAEEFLGYVEEASPDARIDVAGSIRRWKPTIGDVDILVATDSPRELVDVFTGWERVETVIEAGENKASVRARGLRVDLRVVASHEFGSAIQYFTGSRDHNVRLRHRAIERDMKMNEYGVFDISGVPAETVEDERRAGERIAGETERSMYEVLGLPWIPPEMRQDTGEIDAAASGALPDLVDHHDIRGDLHTHTTWSDGNASIEEMADAAERFGLTYLGICDHASGPGIVGNVGLSDAQLLEQYEEIHAVAASREIELFAGVEANIDESGALSTGDDVLAAADLVIASPHSALDQNADAATERLVSAVSHPAVDVLGHPTGRLLNRRPGLDLSIGPLATAAAEHGTALEVNANPHRLDLSGAMVRAAIAAGAQIVINTDAHSRVEFENMRFGVHTARRGWAEPDHILNARTVERLESVLDA